MTSLLSLSSTIGDAYGVEPLACDPVERVSGLRVRVVTETDTFWVRIGTTEPRRAPEVAEEAELVAALHARGVAVAAPRRRADGRYVGDLDLGNGPEIALAYAHVRGDVVAEPSPAQAAAAGALVARVHAAPVPRPCVRRPIDLDTLVIDPLQHVEPWLARHGLALPSSALAIATARRADVEPRVLCHGDVHLENILFDGDAPTLIDFESCAAGPAVYDLACVWRRHVADADDPAVADAFWRAFLDGYARVRGLPRDLPDVPTWAVRRALWVMALPALPGVRWGADWLTDRTYFEAHLAAIEALTARAHR